jgi:hypothetical protein
MKINELIKSFKVFTTNEERAILENMNDIAPLSSFNERERFIIIDLVRKSLISKIVHNGTILVKKNEI